MSSRSWGLVGLLLVLTLASGRSEAWRAPASVLGTALSAALVQVAPPAVLVALPLASAMLLFASHTPAASVEGAVLRTQLAGIAMGVLVRRGFPPMLAILGAAVPLLIPGLIRFLAGGAGALLRPDASIVGELVGEVSEMHRMLNFSEEQIARSSELLHDVAAIVLSITPAIRFIGLIAVFFLIYLVCQSWFARFGIGIRPIGRFTFWRLSHWYAWVFAGGLLALMLPGDSMRVAGRNLLVVMAVAYFVQGLSVTQFLMVKRGIGFLVRMLVYSTAILAIFPFFAAMTTGIGLFDTWFDFRGLEPREADDEDERQDGRNGGFDEND